jgi:hypothetical protein
MLSTLGSLVSAILVLIAVPGLPKNRRILQEDRSVIGKGYPYQYFEDEILTKSDVQYRIIIMRAQIILLSQLYSASLGPSIQSGPQLSVGLPPILMAPRHSQSMEKSSLTVVFESYNLNAEQQQVVADLIDLCLAGYWTPDQVGTCLKLRGGDDGLVRFLVRILWVVVLQNLAQTQGFQPFGVVQPYPRIAAKL